MLRGVIHINGAIYVVALPLVDRLGWSYDAMKTLYPNRGTGILLA
jgi:hypothetical protein